MILYGLISSFTTIKTHCCGISLSRRARNAIAASADMDQLVATPADARLKIFSGWERETSADRCEFCRSQRHPDSLQWN